MTDDEEAELLACITISCFSLLFQLTNEIILFIETNYGDHNFILYTL